MPSIAQLTVQQINVFSQADYESTIETFKRMQRYKVNGRWLGKKNAYRSNTIARIHTDESNGAIKQKHLAEYISASAVLHMSDGWGFLGRAMQAHLVGDQGVARHLAYYAELRAAMAILACNGIGVFNRVHYVITAPQEVQRIPDQLPTHKFAWAALQRWAGSQGSWEMVGDAVQPKGLPIKSWLASAPEFAVFGTVFSHWITSFGLDIQRVANDQDSRNEASYRPSNVASSSGLDPQAEVEFAASIWRSLEPGVRGFPNIDLQLLRLTVEQAFRAVKGKSPGQLPKVYKSLVVNLTSHLPTQQVRSDVGAFLRREAEPSDSLVFELANKSSSSYARGHHLEIMSRAALLLTLSTSSCRLLLEKSDASLDDHGFWWRPLGGVRGMWETPPHSTNLMDLWGDVNSALDDIEEWKSSGIPNSRASLLKSYPHLFSQLSFFELAALWGMSR